MHLIWKVHTVVSSHLMMVDICYQQTHFVLQYQATSSFLIVALVTMLIMMTEFASCVSRVPIVVETMHKRSKEIWYVVTFSCKFKCPAYITKQSRQGIEHNENRMDATVDEILESCVVEENSKLCENSNSNIDHTLGQQFDHTLQ